MSVKLPSHFDFGIDLSADISGIPTSYTFGVTTLPRIDIGIEPITLTMNPLEIKPLDLSFRIKEIPSVRVHLPLDYKIGVALFGAELASVQLCGQAQVITEPYVPNPCECKGAIGRGNIVVDGRDVPAPIKPAG
ncbi:MAG TPA: hypothetical protein VNH44_19600 [Micropepsaceae bacterium]|nr:hypothetical protein [Micropepsaceae bacterium]